MHFFTFLLEEIVYCVHSVNLSGEICSQKKRGITINEKN